MITCNGKIVVPRALQGRIIAWIHHYLVHPGENRMEKTIGRLFEWPQMREQVRHYVKTCRKCQLSKVNTKKYGHLPPKEAEASTPWNRVNVDLIGPYSVKKKGIKQTLQLRAMTMIDPATGWFEVAEIDAPSSDACQQAFDDVWLSRYPRPQYIGYDNGKEFASVFKQMCKNYGITAKPTSSYNPQSNGILERVHQVVGNMLRTF